MRGPNDRQERASRLRIGGWLTHGAPVSKDPATRSVTPATTDGADPGEQPDDPAAGRRARPRGSGAHRLTHPRVPVAAAAIIAALFTAGVIVSLHTEPDGPVAVAPLSPAASPQAIASTVPASWIPTTGPAPRSPATGTSTRGAPPARTGTAAPSPVTPSVTVTTAAVPRTVDLAAEGTLDWVHWGLTSATALDRKQAGTGAIRDRGGSGGRGRYDNNPQYFTWTGGTPTTSAGGTPTGVYACGQGSGFALQVTAAPRTRTLRFYAGVWMARGQLTLKLGTATATATLENRQAITTARFVIRFRAPAGGVLSITWTTAATFHPTCGNVDMQAATLS